jgi:hypothetical protein
MKKLLNTFSVGFVGFLLASALGACSSPKTSAAGLNSNDDLEARFQAVFSAPDVDYVVSYRTQSVLRDFDTIVANVERMGSQKSILSCFVTEEVAGLFVCLGNNKAAQHIPLNRAAIYAESRPKLGVLQSKMIVSREKSESGYQQSSGHDLTEQNLKEFFVALRDSCPDASCVLPGEMTFAQKVMPEFERIYPNGYSVISVDISSGGKLKRALAHESSHGQYFQIPQYRAAVYAFWNALSPEIRIAASDMISQNYERANIDLIINEFHAFTLDGVFSDVSPDYLRQLAQTDPKQATALALLNQSSAAVREALLANLRSAVPLVLYEKILGR